ncbi:MAG: type II toxin-antitoxin system VapC family toxin [Thermomicrobiales bacterium]|nr:type II toxin-antitoxin system VapC family toxin [Thermomicrobiales bacterium]
MIVLDSNVLIDLLRGNPAAHQAFADASRARDQFASSVVAKVELLAGMRAHEEADVREFFGRIAWLDVNDEIAELAGSFASTFARANQGIDTVDFLMAATARFHRAEFWTLNVRHFPMFPELQAPY